MLLTALSNIMSFIVIKLLSVVTDNKFQRISFLIMVTICFNAFNSVYEGILLRYKLLGMLFLGSMFESIISLALILIYFSTAADNT